MRPRILLSSIILCLAIPLSGVAKVHITHAYANTGTQSLRLPGPSQRSGLPGNSGQDAGRRAATRSRTLIGIPLPITPGRVEG